MGQAFRPRETIPAHMARWLTESRFGSDQFEVMTEVSENPTFDEKSGQSSFRFSNHLAGRLLWLDLSNRQNVLKMMPKQDKWTTAAELISNLEADSEYVRRRAKQDEELAKLTAFYREAEAPLVRDLATIGVEVGSVYDLVNDTVTYEKAIPLLLDHLRREYPDAIREGIARALGIPATRALGWRILVDEYRRTENRNNRVKDGLAVALAGASDDSVLHELIELAKDKDHGDSRILLLLGIKRSRRPEARQATNELAHDPQLSKEIKFWRKGRK
jgi:hypothetical protein